MTHQTYPGLEKRPYTLATYETASHHHDGNKKKTYWKDVKQILLMENMTQQDRTSSIIRVSEASFLLH